MATIKKTTKKKKTKKTAKKETFKKESLDPIELVRCFICGASLKIKEARVQINARIGKFFTCIGRHKGKS